MSNYSNAHICQCLTRLSTARRNSPVTISGGRRKTGEQFVDGVLGLSRGLSEMGLRPGHVVAISALNSDLFLEWLLAVAFVGGIVAPLNYRWSFTEVEMAMEVVRPVMLVTDTSCSYWQSEFRIDSTPSLRWHVFINPTIEFDGTVLTTERLRKPYLKSLPFSYSWAPEGAVMICFTSGTTGKPKGVTISHSALIVQSLAKIAIVGYGEDDVYLHTAPLCHIGGISSAMTMLMVGGCHILMPKFEAESAVEAIEKHHVTSLITVPTIMADLVSVIRTKETWKGMKAVEKILNGGGGLSAKLIEEATTIFPSAKLLSAYGMTETCSSLTFMTLYDPTIENAGRRFQVTGKIRSNSVHLPDGICVGKAAPHVELRIKVEGSSSVGRILTRGPHVMLKYWGQTPDSSDSIDEEWLDTGDIGRIDGYGNLWLVGRAKGRIKTGGENVYPEEVEAIISQHPGVAGVVVVGLPDARLTEKVVACVQIRDNWQWAESSSDKSSKNKNLFLNAQTLQRFCQQMKLTGFKVPKAFIIWRKPFPVTTTGKLRREEVRSEVMSQMQLLFSNL